MRSQGLKGRRAALAAVRGRQQHPLGAADDCQERPGPFVVPAAGGGVEDLVAKIGRRYFPKTAKRSGFMLDSGQKWMLSGQLKRASRKLSNMS